MDNFSTGKFTIDIHGITASLPANDGQWSVKDHALLLGLSSYGFRIINPYEFTPRYNEATVPFASGALPIGDGSLSAHDLALATQFYGTDTHDLFWTYFSYIWKQLAKLLDPISSYGYIRYGLHDGAAFNYFRKYIRPKHGAGDLAFRTHAEIGSPTIINLRAEDPRWYFDMATSTVTCTGGSATLVNITADIDGDNITERCVFKIQHTGAGNVQDPVVTVVTTAGVKQFSITGTLTVSGHAWYVDCYRARCYKYTGSSPMADAIANFAGDWPLMDPATTLVSVTSGLANTFTLYVYHNGMAY